MLTPVESFWLQWQARRTSKPASRPAQIVLLAEAGHPSPDIAARLKISETTVRRTLVRFEAQRLALFAPPVLFVDELLDAARVDLAHARRVADHALALFDVMQPVHRLRARLRALTETAALLHNVGVEVDEPNHHTAGRDLLRAMRLVHHTEAEQTMLACSIRFHRKRVRPEKEPLFASLSSRQQQQTLAISALVRIADGLDYSQSQTTRLEAAEVSGQTVTLRVSGPYAELDGERAVEKSDLWAEVFGQNWMLAKPPLDVAALAQTALLPESPITTVAVRAVADQLSRWQAAEPEARAGAPLGIKNLRAAARRARAALDLFAPFFKKKAVKALRRQLKKAEDALGPTRDWDVLIEAAQESAGEQQWAFLEAWRAEREAEHARAVAWLGSAEVDRLRAALMDFLAAPPVRAKREVTLTAGAEGVWAEPLKVLRAQAAALDRHDLRTYHDLRRLGVKRCRFALEFFLPALDERAAQVLKEIVKAQDRLGYLNDSCVALEKLNAWLALHDDDEARAYRHLCEAAIRKHLHKFPKDWEPVTPERLSEKLAALLADLNAAPAVEGAGENRFR